MHKPVMAGFATSALATPIVLLLVAMPSIPAAATNAKQADALCKKNKNCEGGWSNGAWSATVCNPGEECRLVNCPKKGECTVSQRRGTNVLGVLKPLSSGPTGPKYERPPTAGVKLPSGSNSPPSFQSPSSGKRR